MATSSGPPQDGKVMVIDPQFCVRYPVELTVRKKALSLTDRSFTVTDANGTEVLKVKGKLFSIRNSCVLLDAHGNPLVSMQEKIMSFHTRWRVFRGDSLDTKDQLFSVKRSSLIQFKTGLDVYLAANTEEKSPDFKIKGSYLERACTISLCASNAVIAQMSRKYTVKNVVLGQDTFQVTVNPRVDYAFIVALIVVLDEIYESKGE